MALSSFVGSFAQPTSTNASFAVTGTGFQPKVVIFFVSAQTADGSGADDFETIGMATSSADRRTAGYRDVNGNSGASNVTVNNDNTKCIAIVDSNQADTAPKVSADLVSMDGNGFTLNFGVVDATARIINYVALGGADLTNAKTGQLSQPGSTGNVAYTGVGFKPDCLIFWESRNTASIPDTGGHSGNPQLGWGISAAARSANSGTNYDGGAADIVNSYQRTTKIYVGNNFNGSGVRSEADLVTMDADGFTLNWTTAGSNTALLFYLVLKGGQYSVGSFNQPTSTGNQANTSPGFQPAVLLFSSWNNATSASSTTNGRFTRGAVDSTLNRFSLWHGAQDSTNPSVSSNNLDRAKAIKMYTEAGAIPTLNAAADIVSFDSTGWTLNWTTADATAREILYLAIGSNASVGANSSHMAMMGMGM